MNKNKLGIVLGLMMMALSLSACQNKPADEVAKQPTKLAPVENKLVVQNKRVANKGVTTNSEKTEIQQKPLKDPVIFSSGKNPGLKEATREDIENNKGKFPIAIFFTSKKCSICVSKETQLRQFLPIFPDETMLMKIDMDKFPEMKSEYKIAVPGTWVTFDKSGKEYSRNVSDDANSIVTDAIRISQM